MSPHCPRSFEVEALRDGRLGEIERARFERHLETCAPCRRQTRTLNALGDALRTATEIPRDELRERRERTRLLEAFDRFLVESPRVASRRWLWLSAAALALSFVFGVSLFMDLDRPTPAAAVIQAGQAATWSRELTSDRELVRLVQGELRIQVGKDVDKRPLVVTLPDGELEDIGTTFTVTVDAGHTTRVWVQEGMVLLRLRGQAPLTLVAGQTWTREGSELENLREQEREPHSTARATETATASPPFASPLHPDQGSEATRSKEASPSGAAAPPQPAIRSGEEPKPSAPTSTIPRAALPVPSAVRDAASESFREAVATLHAGDARRAAQRLAEFVERYPGDARAEDASYLRVLALHRSGNGEATRAAAQRYLKRYPSGFRRTEVEELAR